MFLLHDNVRNFAICGNRISWFEAVQWNCLELSSGIAIGRILKHSHGYLLKVCSYTAPNKKKTHFGT